jgi:hypothetical protein
MKIIFLFLFILFVFAAGIYFLFWKRCNYFSTTTPGCLLPEGFSFDKKDLSCGEAHMKNSSVVICGLARDCSQNLDRNMEMIISLAKKFKNYKILIVENDSQDGTRKKLLGWVEKDPNVEILGCGVNAKICSLKLDKTIDHEVTNGRIKKMSYLRNLYLERVKEFYSGMDYMLVFDFDISGVIYLDGMADSFCILSKRTYVNGITANGMKNDFGVKKYYDPFALFSKDTPSCFASGEEKRDYDQKMLEDGELPSENGDHFYFSPIGGPFPVKSAFAGLGIYRISSVMEKGASYDLNCSRAITCEHTPFSEALGKIMINPRMILLVFQH